jgi:Gas vesicle synthesis protein GvpO
MAERKQSGNNNSSSSKLKAVEAVARAREQLEELIGRRAETVSSFGADDSNGWTVTVEVLELERIPESTSLLGSYEVKLDKSGDLVGARRVRRYSRNQVDVGGNEDE